MLAQAGRLSLDDDIRKYIPEMPDFGKAITPRHLIHHTSGLRDTWELLQFGGWRMEDVITLRGRLENHLAAARTQLRPANATASGNGGYMR